MIQNYNGYKVLEQFLNNQLKGFKLREISKNLRLGLPSVSNYIKQLEKEHLIVKKEVYGMKLYFANRENSKFKIYKIQDSKTRLDSSGLIELLEKELNYPTIVLFGSKAKGEDTEKSDYDLAVFTETKRELNLNNFENKLNSKIQLFVFNDKDVKNMKIKNKELLNSIMNGITIRGFLKLL